MNKIIMCGIVKREGYRDQLKETAEISQSCSQLERWGMVAWEDVSKEEMTGLTVRSVQALWELQFIF